MKKILLIEAKPPSIHVYSRVPIPRVGSVLLGTILRDRGYDVKVFVENINGVDEQAFREADLIGLSSTTSTAPQCYNWCRRARKLGIPTVIGGTHVTFLPDEGLDYADYVVRGEGEETLVELVEALEGNRSLESVKGLSYRDGNETIHNPDRPAPENLDELPIPDFRLISGSNLFRVVTIMSSRGCPYGCSFCSVTAFNGRRYRSMSVDRTLEHLDFYRGLGERRYIFFGDDIFNLDGSRAREIVRGMVDNGMDIRWGAQVRHEASRDEELLELMSRSNCDRVFVGFESINPRTLELYGKKETVNEIKEAVNSFHRHRVKVHGMFVIGSDADTAETIHHTLDASREWGIDTVQYMILTPLPGSQDFKAYETGDRELVTRDWAMFDGHHAVHVPEQMSPYELQTETMKAMRRFYSPARILKALVKRDWFETIVSFVGLRLTRQWKRIDRYYVAKLREDLERKAQKLVGNKAGAPLPRTVAIAHTEATVGLDAAMRVFFRELGVRVIHSRQVVSGAVTQGYETLARGGGLAGKRVSALADGLRREAVCVVRPILRQVASGSAKWRTGVEEKWGGIRKSLSNITVIDLHLELQPGVLRQRLLELGLLFSRDIRAIRRASAKSVALIEGLA